MNNFNSTNFHIFFVQSKNGCTILCAIKKLFLFEFIKCCYIRLHLFLLIKFKVFLVFLNVDLMVSLLLYAVIKIFRQNSLVIYLFHKNFHQVGLYVRQIHLNYNDIIPSSSFL